MTESEVLKKFDLFKEGLIKKNAKIEELTQEIQRLELAVSNLETENSDKSFTINQLVEQNAEKANVIEQLRTDYKSSLDRYDDLKGKTYKTIKRIVENVIEKQEKDIEELNNELHQKELDIDNLNKSINSFESQIENKKKDYETEDVDVMMTKIHTTDVDSSVVDETMQSIKKGEKLFKQYSFGVANKETIKMFEKFIHRLYIGAPLIGRYYILNNPSNCLDGLDPDACQTLLHHLVCCNIIESRKHEYVTQYLEEAVVKAIVKEC